MKRHVSLTFGFVFLISSLAFGLPEGDTDYTSQLKADSGPLCANFTVGKSLTIFCLKDPTTQILYQFGYSIRAPDIDNPKMKVLRLSTYDPAISKFVLKMTAVVSFATVREATMDDAKLWGHLKLPIIDADKNASDEAYFHAMITDDLYPARQSKDPTLGPKSSAPEAKFLDSVFNHLAMTPIAQQKLVETSSLPKMIQIN